MVTAHALSPLDRVARLLDGLSDDLRRKVIRQCTKQGWKLSTHDTGTKDPEYDQIAEFILTEARTNQTMAVYDNERSIRERSGTSAVTDKPAPTLGITSTPPAATTAAPIVTPDPIAELTKQFAQLALALQANPASNPPTTSSSNAPGPARTNDRPFRCVWCDSTVHARRDCPEFAEALGSKRVSLNEKGRILYNGEELPLMYGKGGMKRLVAPMPISVGTNNITLENYGNIGPESSIHVTTLDFETGIRTDEIIDAQVEEKRRRDEILRRRVRPRLEDTGNPVSTPPVAPAPAAPSSTPSNAPITDVDMSDAPSGSVSKKFRLASELNQSISTAQIAEKIMDAPVQLSMREILAVSTDISGYINEQTRKRRVPLDPTVPSTVSNTANVSSASADPGHLKQLYACPSGRAKVTIDREVSIDALLDNGSEVNIMPQRIFEQTNLPIDTEIRWRINAYDSKTNAKLDEHGPIGVCHDVPVDIGGVEVKQAIFVVKHCNNDLILGRPWERMARAEYINEDDGSYTVKIKSLDNRRMVQFCAAKPEHERNREFARDAGDFESLKD